MKRIDCSTLCLPLLCRMLNYCPSPVAQSITCLDDTRPGAGVIYDNYNSVSVCCHIWVAPGFRPSREWYGAIFDYPFNKLGVRKLVGQVAERNKSAAKLDEHFGFVKEAVIKDFSPDGDLIIYTMTRDQCRVLNAPMWSRTTQNLGRVA